MSSRPALSIVDHDQSAREGNAPRAFVTRASSRSVLTAAPALPRFHLEPGFEGRRDVRNADMDEPLFEPANLTVHISALRRALRGGRAGNRFFINIPGRGHCFRCSRTVAVLFLLGLILSMHRLSACTGQ